MKNSGWYHKLWNKKLDELPVQGDMDLSWKKMHAILDQQMPLQQQASGDTQTGSAAVKTIGSKIVSMLAYILPAAAMVSVFTYVTLKEPKTPKNLPKNNYKAVLKKIPAAAADSLYNDTLASDSGLAQASLTPGDLFISKDQTSAVSEPATSPDTVYNMTFLSNTALTQVKAARNSHFLWKDSTNHLIWNAPGATVIPVIHTQIKPADLKADKKAARELLRKERLNRDKAVQISDRKIKVPKVKRQKSTFEGDTSLSYSVSAGLNTANAGSGLFFAGTVHYAISKRLGLSTGMIFNTKRAWTSGYMASNYNVSDSLKGKTIGINDERKLSVLDVPLNLEYRISKKLSIKGGPVLSIRLKEGGSGSRLGYVAKPADTLMNSKKIDTALAGSTLSGKFTLGYQAGFILRFGRFNLEATYLQNLSPYHISSSIGSYAKRPKNLNLGVGFRF